MSQGPHLIIGAGAAALGCLAGIRSADARGPITLIAPEREPYLRPLLPYWLEGRTDDRAMRPLDPAFLQRNGARAMLGERVATIDCAGRAAVLEGGGRVPFGTAFIAAGGRPVVPPSLKLPGVAGAETLADWESARRVKDLVDSGSLRRAVVVGAGFIGLKVAEALTNLVVRTTVVELGERVLGGILDAEAARLVARAMEEQNIGIRCGVSVDGVEQHAERVTGVVLSDGSLFSCELVLVAVGMKPDLRLVEGTPIATGRGILVDEHLRTSVPGVYAGGDVAEGNSAPTLVSARRQGFVAGCNMAGQERTVRPEAPMNSTDVCGLPCITIGDTRPEGGGPDTMVTSDPVRLLYRKIVLRGNRCVGAILLGDVEGAGVLARLVRQRIDVSSFRQLLREGPLDPGHLPAAYWHSS